MWPDVALHPRLLRPGSHELAHCLTAQGLDRSALPGAGQPREHRPGPEDSRGESKDGSGDEQRQFRPRRYYRWAELMQRVFEVDVLVCEHCGGRRRVLTFLTDSPVLRSILEHFGLPADPPPIASARAPPEPELPFA